jgi:DNA-binding FadR family transcriptional regulator
MSATSDGIVRRMVILIAAGEWSAGDELPRLKELMASWRISEVTAAEVLVALKTGGLTADGPGGAAVVTAAGRHIAELMVRENEQG